MTTSYEVEYNKLSKQRSRYIATHRQFKAKPIKIKLTKLAESLLPKLREEYEKVYQKLVLHMDKKPEEKKELLKRELALNKIITHMKRITELLATDPCPLTTQNKDCLTCEQCSLSLVKEDRRKLKKRFNGVTR